MQFNGPNNRRNSQVINITMRDMYAILLKRVDHFNHNTDDPDAFCQQVLCEVEKKMGIYPNIGDINEGSPDQPTPP